MKDFFNYLNYMFFKIKLLKLTMIGAAASGITLVAVASAVAKEMCKKKSKEKEA